MVLVATTYAGEQYATKYDDVDIDRILQNKRILTNYIKCMMEEGSCTSEGRELKSKFIIFIFVYSLKHFQSVFKRIWN